MHQLARIFAVITLFTLSAHAQPAWTLTRTNFSGVLRAQSVAFGNGRFVVTLLSQGSRGPGAAWSADGFSWSPARSTLPQLGSVTFSAGSFLLAGTGGVWRSADGDNWQQIHVAADPNQSLSLVASDGRGLVTTWRNIAATKLIYSPDLVEWRETAPLPEAGPPNLRALTDDLVFFGGRYVANYYLTQANGTSRYIVAATADGATWTPLPAINSAQWIASGNGRLIAFAVFPTGAVVLSSSDAVNFTRTSIPAGLSNNGRMAFGGGRFFLLGSLTASVDGVTWGGIGAPPTYPGLQDIQSVAYGNGRYVAVGAHGNPLAVPPVGNDAILVLPAPAPPIVTSPPAVRTVAEGSRVTLDVTLDNPDTITTFQWRRDGAIIAGATLARHTIDSATAADAGRYTTDIRNAAGAVSTEPSELKIVPASQAGRIANLSVLTALDRPNDSFTMGFVVGGGDAGLAKPVLVRAGGPALAALGVANPNPDPRLELWSGGAKVGENDNWSGTPALVSASAQVGAFAFSSGASADAALVASVARGSNSLIVSANGGAIGPVIAEVYDATAVPAITTATPRLINVSTLKHVAANTTLAVGFVISGLTEKTVLIRAVGPGLTPFLGDRAHPFPTLAFFRNGSNTPLATNTRWRGAVQLAQASAAAGAFQLLPESNDAALLLALPPGNYTAQVTGVDGAAGTVLLEIYDVP